MHYVCNNIYIGAIKAIHYTTNISQEKRQMQRDKTLRCRLLSFSQFKNTFVAITNTY